jgi:beta-N-acetylhexosaminidase
VRRRTLALAVTLAVTAGAAAAGCSGAPERPGAEVAGPSAAGALGTSPEARMPSVPRPDACATAALRAMSLREQAGQLVLVGVAAGRPDQAADVVSREGVAGVFLRGRTTRSLADLRRRIGRLRDAAGTSAPGLFVAVDQEGGVVWTLRGPGFTDVPAAGEQARMPVDRVRALTGEWAAELADAGVNLDLAPVADTVPAGREESNPPIGAHGRQFGAEPDAVARRVSAVSAALRSHGVLPTVKHFPGLGRVRVNTDTGRGAVDRTADASDPHLAPFAAGVRAGAGAVMVSSATYPQLDPRHPAVFSPVVIEDLLRTGLGWNGLVVSDDVAVAEAVRHVPLWRRAVDFVAAGGDLVLTVRSEYAGPMVAALVLRAERDEAFRARVAESAGRVLQAKRSVGLLSC